ncbi:MAG: magnesium transporter [Nitrospinota bacterium]|nr:magnesium transporter [Nitrospinota bacterium]
MTPEEEKHLAIQEEILDRSQPEKALDDLYHPADIAAAIEHIEDESRMLEAFTAVGVEMGSQILPLLDESSRELILDNSSPEELAELIGEMNTDDAADLLGEMEVDVAEEVLGATSADVDEQVSRLLLFEPETAGGIMQTELIAASEEMTLDQTLSLLRSRPDINREVYNIFVVDNLGRLKGVAPIIELMLNPGSKKVGEMVDEGHPPIYVYADDDQENVASLFKKYDLISLAVVDRDMVLLGRILIDDIVDVFVEEADEDIMALVGVNEEVLSPSTSVVEMARYRLPWLTASLGGGFVTGALIWSFKGTLEAAMALAAFIPIVMGMSGNVGAQSSTLVVRGIATGRIEQGDLVTFIYKELKVGFILGVICGLISGVVAGFWQASPGLGLIMGGAVFLAINLAALMGASIPLIFRWLDVDPAIAGGPIVLAINDITAVLIFLTLATLLIHLLH